jgi:RNA polymerase sigma factor (sigma-70 family)
VNALPDSIPDRTLLHARGAEAFADLVARHGRMVYGVCLRVLRNSADADDAFQATFFVLFRKAPTLRRGESIGGWLHTVALRIALRARKRQAARYLLEREAAMTAESPVPQPEPQWTADLDAALARLPNDLRRPLVLCYLEGKTGDEAAAELGCSRSTLTRRLTEGREVLRKQLERAGVVVSAAAVMAVLDSAATAAEPPGAAVAALTGPMSISPAALSLAGSATVGAGASAGTVAALAAIMLAVASAAVFVRPGKPADEPNVETVAEPQPAAAENPKPAPVAPAKLKDAQKIGMWKGHTFHWEPADAALVRPRSFAITIPPGHNFVTVVVDDPSGVRVRNLLDAVEVTALGGKPDATEPQTLAVEWNGLDDRGRPLPDGAYRVRGCSHPGMKCIYEYSFLNPGTPPWNHYPNSAWGGNHGFPHAIACLRSAAPGAWRVAVGGTIAEGGSPAFILGADDRKIHAFGRGWSGAKAFAAADGQLWVGLWQGKDLLRLEYHTGKQVPFKTAKGSQLALTFDADVWGIAVAKSRVAVRLHDDKDPKKERVMIFDRETGENRVEVRFANPIRRNGLAARADGKTIVVSTDGGLFELDSTEPKPAPRLLALNGVEKPGPLATDAKGNLHVLDRGAEYRVKVFAPNGELLREIGTKGGQGERLEYDPEALHGVEAIAVDDDGRLWAAENGDQDNRPGRGFVRRIAVWKPDGKLDRDFVGTTWYGANNTCLHEQDPTLALGYGVIYKLDPGRKPGYRPWKYLTSGQPADAPLWHWSGSPGTLFGAVRMFRSDASGKERDYVLQMNGFPILFQADDLGEYRPVLAIGSHEHFKAFFPQVKGEPKALFLWTDLNGDAKPSDDEFQRVPGSNYSVHFFMGWGYPPPRDLTWHVEGRELKPKRFTDRGVPVYDVAAAKQLPVPQYYLRVGKHLVATVPGKWDSPEAGYFFAGNYLFADADGKPVATYRCNWPGVHASWQAAIAKPGQTGRTAGELFVAGSADTNGELGHVLCTQGNQGQAFLLSEDGLFVHALYKDTRQNPKGRGAKEEFGADWSENTLYSECFGGWFGRQSDGKVRHMFGNTGCQVVRIEGLEAVKRFDAGTVELRGPVANGTPAAKEPPAERLLNIPNVRGRFPAFKADGDPAEWSGIPRREIKVGDDTVAKVALAHSLEHLWILAEVEDASPWKNSGTEPPLIFKTGDAIDLNLGPERPARAAPIAGDIRVLIAPGKKKPIAMAYRPVKADAKPTEAFKFESPVRSLAFASVVPVSDAEATFKPTATGYVVEIRLPCDSIGLRHAESGLRLRGDIGVLWGNEAGLVTERRAYLFNRGPGAGIVSDVPSEAELHPAEWGTFLLK